MFLEGWRSQVGLKDKKGKLMGIQFISSFSFLLWSVQVHHHELFLFNLVQTRSFRGEYTLGKSR